MEVLTSVDREALESFGRRVIGPGATVYTDDWGAYGWIAESGRGHATVCHSARPREWARDDDGDGVREVHDNTMEGAWTGLRNFLRPFRGISKWYLDQYVGMFQWAYTLKAVTAGVIRALCGLWPLTNLGA